MKSKDIKKITELDGIAAQDRKTALKRFQILMEYLDEFIPPLKKKLKRHFRVDAAVREFSAKKGISPNTLYRWISVYQKKGIKALAPSHRHSLSVRPAKAINADIVIPFNNPLRCLIQVGRVINASPRVTVVDKARVSRFIDRFQEAVSRKTNLKMVPPLTQEEVTALNKYRAGNHKKHSAKATVILMANQRRSLLDVMLDTGKQPGLIYRWLKEFRGNRLESIVTKMHYPMREAKEELRRTRTLDIIHKHPSLYNINRSSWSFPSISEAYQQEYGEYISKDALQRVMKTTGYTWRHARKVLTSPDPLYREKIEKVIDTLHSLGGNEAFFFIDEVGPYRVRKYGGYKLMPPDQIEVIPEFQRSRGKVQFIAGLEAASNQLTWLFTKDKTAGSLVSFMRILLERYHHCDRIFLTWDALSVHRSKVLLAWLYDQKRAGSSPRIEIVPLPTNSQFLNVIEAVFGGMKRAVICNSNYPSAAEMEAAIGRYFEERNQYFQLNPKRAGNKIWDKESFDFDKLIGGLFKKM